MSKNKVKDGDQIEFVAATARLAGEVEVVGQIVGVHERTVAIGDVAVLSRRGTWLLPILSTDTPAQGVRLYWDDPNRRLTTTASTFKLAGFANTAKITGITTIECILAGGMQ
jgi:predicted RecA/RadA family phage recombinase